MLEVQNHIENMKKITEKIFLKDWETSVVLFATVLIPQGNVL